MAEPYQGDYMAQEDEWEREGLLDPEWEKQQRKVSKNLFFSFILIHFVGCCDFLFCCKILHRVSKLAESYSTVSYLCSIHT